MALTCETNRSDNCSSWPSAAGERVEPGTVRPQTTPPPASAPSPASQGSLQGAQGRGKAGVGGEEARPKKKPQKQKHGFWTKKKELN